MIKDDYREIGLKTYGAACEICGQRSPIEVHHINYQEHQEWEDMLRQKVKSNLNPKLLDGLVEQAKSKGFLYWDGKNLSKDDRSTNLSVLCSNHHSLVHTIDAGMNLLNALPERK
jgi:hypothetical protein